MWQGPMFYDSTGSMYSINHHNQPMVLQDRGVQSIFLSVSSHRIHVFWYLPQSFCPTSHQLQNQPSFGRQELSHQCSVPGVYIYKLQNHRDLGLNDSFAEAFSEWFYRHKTKCVELQRQPINCTQVKNACQNLSSLNLVF